MLQGFATLDNVKKQGLPAQKTSGIENVFLTAIQLGDHRNASAFLQGFCPHLPGDSPVKRVFVALSQARNVSFYQMLSELAYGMPELFRGLSVAALEEHFTPNLPAVSSIFRTPYKY